MTNPIHYRALRAAETLPDGSGPLVIAALLIAAVIVGIVTPDKLAFLYGLLLGAVLVLVIQSEAQ
jgi:uncharacterized membrane protein YraQ (UPF0718 family)